MEGRALTHNASTISNKQEEVKEQICMPTPSDRVHRTIKFWMQNPEYNMQYGKMQICNYSEIRVAVI